MNNVDPSFYSKINELDLSQIRQKLLKTKALPINERQAAVIEMWYKRFLFIYHKYPHRALAVSEIIDKYWHQHILDTRRYQSDCISLFGRMLHHNPYIGLNDGEDNEKLEETFAKTDMLMMIEFGESMKEGLKNQLMVENGDPLLESSLCASDCDSPDSSEDD